MLGSFTKENPETASFLRTPRSLSPSQRQSILKAALSVKFLLPSVFPRLLGNPEAQSHLVTDRVNGIMTLPPNWNKTLKVIESLQVDSGYSASICFGRPGVPHWGNVNNLESDLKAPDPS
ncbi:hypothetical protein NPIL_82351 [Nephila pilipes]|uniref:Uncharacterized protein n=1 Tax=Nephila pilipes TaxID=299642 RepID=A0A8X6QWM9_NEPPI|nr:hypothetical protein NPIL_82351 [Nephila pilipes]